MTKTDYCHNRIDWIDCSKGIVILLMVLGHTSIPQLLSNFIWAFHMPFFFIISGLLTDWNKYSKFEFFIHRAKALIIPFFVYSLIVITIQFFMGFNSYAHLMEFGWDSYALWFIPVLFISSIVVRLISDITRIFRWGIILCIVSAGIIFCYCKIYLPWTIHAIPYATFLIFLGAEIKPYINSIYRLKWYIVLLAFIITFTVSHFFRLDMCTNHILPVIPITTAAFAGSIMIYNISYYLDQCSKLLSKMLASIGKETYVILAFSQIIIIMLNKYLVINAVLKYCLLAALLLFIVIVKNYVSKLYRSRCLL